MNNPLPFNEPLTTGNKKPAVAIVILNWNGKKFLKKFVAKLAKNETMYAQNRKKRDKPMSNFV